MSDHSPDSIGESTRRLRVGVVTTIGNYREQNEDNFFIPGINSSNIAHRRVVSERVDFEAVNGESTTPGQNLFIVADGMGGQLAGEHASRLAVEIIPRELSIRLAPELDDQGFVAAIRGAVAAANSEIIAQSHVLPEYNSMGTTVVLALFRGDRAFVTGIGDSRVYRLRGGQIERLTRDHDLGTALREVGTISTEEMEHNRYRHVLYLYLGSPEAREGPKEIQVLDVRPGDVFLLASDGLTGVVRDEQLAEVLSRTADPSEAAQQLVDRALANDSRDNITCVVVQAS